MVWFIIISLLVIGLGLLIAEIVFIPGTTVVGILGIGFSIVGVLMAFDKLGQTTGYYVMLGTLSATAVALYFSFRSGAWSRFSNNSAIDSKVNEGSLAHLRVGDIGEAVSALRPFGKAEFGSTIIEVKSTGNYASPKSKLKIIRIESNQVIVEVIS